MRMSLSGADSVQCCLPSLVPAEFAICGKNLTVNGNVSGNKQFVLKETFFGFHQVVIQADQIPCHTTESFFTWDALHGINLDILLLLVDGVLLFLLLILIESKALARLWFG